MIKFFKTFRKDEAGAVTVDWVVLTAAVVALAGAAFSSIQTASGGVGTGVGNHLSAVEVGE
jgi:Flp pilus assembly pilin Flp